MVENPNERTIRDGKDVFPVPDWHQLTQQQERRCNFNQVSKLEARKLIKLGASPNTF